VCVKMIINSGIERVVTDDDYPDELAADLLNQAGIDVVTLEGSPCLAGSSARGE
jgi:dCMP deaminase